MKCYYVKLALAVAFCIYNFAYCMIQPALFTYFLSPACCRSPTIIYFMTMRSQRLRRSKLNSLYSRRRAFEDDASSLLTTISSQFRRHLSRRNVHFLQLASVACCARKFARECRTNHWTLCASYAHTMLLRGLLLIVINLNKPNSCS